MRAPELKDGDLKGVILPMGRWFRAVMYRASTNFKIDSHFLNTEQEAWDWLTDLADAIYRQSAGEDMHLIKAIFTKEGSSRE